MGVKKRQMFLWLAVVIVVWAACWGLTIGLAGLIGPDRATAFGAVGDMFGASSALFAGLGFFGLLFVLFHDLSARKVESDRRAEDVKARTESRRPFLASKLRPGVEGGESVSIVRAIWDGRIFSIRVAVELTIENLADDPALNTEVAARVVIDGHVLKASVDAEDSPLVKGNSSQCRLFFTAEGDTAEAMLESFIGRQAIEVDLVLSCLSLEHVSWMSSVTYTLTVAREADIATLRIIGNGESGESITEVTNLQQVDSSIGVKGRVKQGSWQHGPTPLG